jgi:hypothetical protein
VRDQPAHGLPIAPTAIRYDVGRIATDFPVLLKIIVFAFVAAILYSLASSFYFLVRDKGEGDRTVRRLSWRIGLSLLLVLLLYAGFELGLIEPGGMDPVAYPVPGQGESGPG